MSAVFKVITVVAAAALLAACGGNGNGDGGGGDKAGGGDGGNGGASTLSTVDNAFQPSSLTTSSGAEIEITNEGQSTHNFTIEDSDVSQDVEAGQSISVIIDVDPGDFTMFCKYHRATGMEGVIKVQ